MQPAVLHEPDVDNLPLLGAGHGHVPDDDVDHAVAAPVAVAACAEPLPLLQGAAGPLFPLARLLEAAGAAPVPLQGVVVRAGGLVRLVRAPAG